MVADVQNAVDHNLGQAWRRRVARARLRLEDSIVIRCCLQQPLAPLLDPGASASQGIGEVLDAPIGAQLA